MSIHLKRYPETGEYRLYCHQQNSCRFFDASDHAEAKTYAAGVLACQVIDKHGRLTYLPTGDSWAIAVNVIPLACNHAANVFCAECGSSGVDVVQDALTTNTVCCEVANVR